MNTAYGIGEGLLSTGSSILLSPYAGLKGLLYSALYDEEEGRKAIEGVLSNAYQPRSMEGEGVMYALGKAGEVLDAPFQYLGDTVFDLTGSPGLATAAYSGSQLIPTSLLAKSIKMGDTSGDSVPSRFGQSGVIIGSKGMDREMLDKAKDMKADGRDDMVIFNQTMPKDKSHTGILMGSPDGLPVTEMPTNDITLNPLANNQIWNEEANITLFGDGNNGLLHGGVLQDRYPEIRGIPTVRQPFIDAHGSYVRRVGQPNQILLSTEAPDTLSTALHETTHAIQDVDGISTGGSPRGAGRYRDDLKREKLHREFNVRELENEANINGLFDSLDNARGSMDSTRFYEASDKLFEYSKHDSPTRIKKHIMGYSNWLHDKDLRDLPEAKELVRLGYAMPKKHKKAERTEFLRNYAHRLGRLLRDQIPKEELAALKNDSRKPKSIMNSKYKDYDKALKELRPLNDAKQQVKHIDNYLDHYLNPFNFKGSEHQDYETYKNLLGEVNARVPQQIIDGRPRYTMGTDELQGLPFFSDPEFNGLLIPRNFYKGLLFNE